jgi:hypothetical protein
MRNTGVRDILIYGSDYKCSDSRLWYAPHMRSRIWIAIFIGSMIGGFIPMIWGDDMLSYSGVLFSGIGALVGLWLGSRAA